MSQSQDRLSKLIQMRPNTDVRISTKWIFFAAATYVLWTVLAILFVTGLLQQIPSFSLPVLLGSIFFDATTWISLLGLGASMGLAYVVFRVIDRQNKHALRMQEVFSEALKRVRSETSLGQKSALLPLSSAEQDISAMVQRSRERSGILWATLVLIPYLGWIFLIIGLYHLSQTSDFHVQTERLLLEDLERVRGTAGPQQLPVNNQFLPRRDSTGFLIASLVTIGLFSIFWLYQMVSSPRDHFNYHSDFEPKLLSAFEGSQFAGGAKT
jgi:hypothetical protein